MKNYNCILLANGHSLIEGVPESPKQLLPKLFGKDHECRFLVEFNLRPDFNAE